MTPGSRAAAATSDTCNSCFAAGQRQDAFQERHLRQPFGIVWSARRRCAVWNWSRALEGVALAVVVEMLRARPEFRRASRAGR
jgi:hypothetical protein